MKLFFETDGQGVFFLLSMPIGLLIALCLDGTWKHQVWRFVADVLLLVGTGLAMILLFVCTHNNALRLYQLLGLITGSYIYTKGMRKVCRCKIKASGRK